MSERYRVEHSLNGLEAEVADLRERLAQAERERGEWHVVHDQLTEAYKAQCDRAEAAEAKLAELVALVVAWTEAERGYNDAVAEDAIRDWLEANKGEQG